MSSNVTNLGVRAASLLGAAIIGILSLAWAAATSPAVKRGIRAGASAAHRGVVTILRSVVRFLGRQYPSARDFVRRGIIGGWRYFRGQFNNNRASMIQGTRNRLSPLEWVAIGGSAVVFMVNQVLGFALLLMTIVVFFQDPDELSLSSFGLDSAGVGSVVGVGTTLIINLFVLLSAIPATINYVRTQI